MGRSSSRPEQLFYIVCLRRICVACISSRYDFEESTNIFKLARPKSVSGRRKDPLPSIELSQLRMENDTLDSSGCCLSAKSYRLIPEPNRETTRRNRRISISLMFEGYGTSIEQYKNGTFLVYPADREARESKGLAYIERSTTRKS